MQLGRAVLFIINFIDVPDPEHRRCVLASLEQPLLKDRVKIFSTRINRDDMQKNTLRALNMFYMMNAHLYNQGRETVKPVETLCYDILREIVRINRIIDVNRFSFYVSAVVV